MAAASSALTSGPAPGEPRPERDRELPVDHLRRHARSLRGVRVRACSATRLSSGRRPGRRPARRGRRGRRGCRASGMWLLTNANTSTRPRASVTRPARALVPVSVPVLARTQPRPGCRSKRSASDPSYAATGRPVTTEPQLGVVGRRRRAGARRPGSRRRVGRAGRARCRPGSGRAAQVDAEAASGSAHGRARRRRTSRGRSTSRPTWWASTSAPSLSLTCSTCSTMSASGRLVTRATSRARGARPALARPAP